MSTYIRLISYLRPHLGVFGLAIGCMVVSTLLNGVQLGAIFPLADRIITDKAIPTPEWLPSWLAGFVSWLNAVEPIKLLGSFAMAIPVLFCLKGLFEFWQTFYMNDTAQRIIRDLRQGLFNRFMGLSVDYHSKTNTGTMMSRILHDVGVIQNSITEGCSDLVFQGLQILMYLSIALMIDWKLSMLIVFVVAGISLPVTRIGKLLKKLSRSSQIAMAQLNSVLHESLLGVRIIKVFLAEERVREKFATVNERSYRVLRKLQKRMNALSPLTEFIGALGGAVFFYFGGREVLLGHLTLGTFMAFLLAMLQLIHPCKRLARLHGVIQQAMASAERIFEVMDTPISIHEREDAKPLDRFSREIVYNHVSFHYDGKPALRDVSLTIPFGQTYALVGPSGGGKTTFANLLLRFYDPRKGTVTIDGVDVNDVTIASLRSQIGLVTQETFLFNDTVRANIALGKPSATDDEVLEAAHSANAHEFICRLPDGYDTIIGERGSTLSGGQCQRLAIARAILKNPPILILDEATSQLDAESEHLISGAIEQLRKSRTVILIAHRLSTVRLAHRIVLLQEGRIIEQGSHDELLQKSPLYRRFCELQLMDVGTSESS